MFRAGMSWPALVLCSVLLVLLQSHHASGVVIELSSNTTYLSRSAAFGPLLELEVGRRGPLVPMAYYEPDNVDACRPMAVPCPNITDWVALVMRGGEECYFIDKVRHMMECGAYAVIVGNNQPGLIIMNANENDDDVTIPAVLIEQTSYFDLFSRISPESPYTTEVLLLREEYTVWPMLDVVLVVLVTPLVLFIFFYSVWRVRRRMLMQREVAPPAVVITLPRKTFSKSEYVEGDPDTCAICLEDFEDGADLRQLPCKHEFHVLCIDPWLTTRKRFCPLCKADALTPVASATQPEGEPLLHDADVEAAAGSASLRAAPTADESPLLSEVVVDSDDGSDGESETAAAAQSGNAPVL